VTSDAVGHYHTTAGALAFMGAVGMTAAAIDSFWLPQDLGFIDSNAIFAISTLFFVVAGWMWTRRADPSTV